MEGQRILAINPGSTSTKIAVFEEAKSIFTKNIKHTTEELQPFAKITDQFQFRKDIILKEFNPVYDRLKSLWNVDLQAIESELEQLGAPYTPGRFPELKN
ncbi:MAG: hypothetical protein CVU05_14000 [Bacteroidetes bacterium HGW-Bacteroidetes-21]|nr:MAG: hypothetical protein CVU05_14000 [Bacteroidetes bacterium HGW-Bacteroidetes-21]